MYKIVKHLPISILKRQAERLSGFTVHFLRTQFLSAIFFGGTVSTVTNKVWCQSVTKNYLNWENYFIFQRHLMHDMLISVTLGCPSSGSWVWYWVCDEVLLDLSDGLIEGSGGTVTFFSWDCSMNGLKNIPDAYGMYLILISAVPFPFKKWGLTHFSLVWEFF